MNDKSTISRLAQWVVSVGIVGNTINGILHLSHFIYAGTSYWRHNRRKMTLLIGLLVFMLLATGFVVYMEYVPSLIAYTAPNVQSSQSSLVSTELVN